MCLGFRLTRPKNFLITFLVHFDTFDTDLIQSSFFIICLSAFTVFFIGMPVNKIYSIFKHWLHTLPWFHAIVNRKKYEVFFLLHKTF